jgi:protein SCO1/2
MRPPARVFPAPSAHLLLGALLAAAACGNAGDPAPPGPTKEYDLRGQVLSVRPEINEIRIDHEAIPGFMDAMVMSFSVKDPALLSGLARGDLVAGTLVVAPTDAWLSRLVKVGTAPVEEVAEGTAPPAVPFTLLEPGQPVPDQAFVDQNGTPWSPAAFRGKAWALGFIYTRCPLPTYCPLIDRQFKAAQVAVAARADLRDRVRFVTVSFDPDFDTPAVLAAHARTLGAEAALWRFVTAPREEVDAFAAKFGVSVMREPDNPASITHNLRTAVVSPAGTITAIYSGGDWTPARLVEDLAAAAR